MSDKKYDTIKILVDVGYSEWKEEDGDEFEVWTSDYSRLSEISTTNPMGKIGKYREHMHELLDTAINYIVALQERFEGL